ncbi:MAG: hypothetical protein FD129_2334, partial [bacterium]
GCLRRSDGMTRVSVALPLLLVGGVASFLFPTGASRSFASSDPLPPGPLPFGASELLTRPDRPRPVTSFSWPERQVAEIFRAADSTRSAELFHLDPVGLSLDRPLGPMLPLHDPLLADPLRAPSVAWGLASDILSASSGAARLVVLAAEQQGHPVDLKAASNVVEDAWRKSDRPDALFDAIADFYDGGRRLSGNARDGLRRLAPRVPDRVGRIAAFLLRCRTSALAFHKIAFDEARLPRERLDRRNFDTLAMSWLDSLEVAPPADAEEAFRVAAAGVDWSALNQEALILAMAVDNAVIMLDSLEVGAMVRPGTVAESATGPATAMDPAMHFIWDTPQGRIALGGAGPQAFEGPHLLILDLGGDDSYRGAGSAVFPDRPIALIVDR